MVTVAVSWFSDDGLKLQLAPGGRPLQLKVMTPTPGLDSTVKSMDVVPPAVTDRVLPVAIRPHKPDQIRRLVQCGPRQGHPARQLEKAERTRPDSRHLQRPHPEPTTARRRLCEVVRPNTSPASNRSASAVAVFRMDRAYSALRDTA